MVRKLAVLALLCVAVLLCAAFATRHGDLADRFGDCQRDAAPAPWQHLDQGWDAQQQWEFWYTSQGSQMLPYAWFLALEQPDQARPFAAPEHLARLGFINAPRGRCNPDALPVGFTLDASTGQLGLSCAACHTRLIRDGNRQVLVDGAPAEIHFNRFVRLLAVSLEHTLAHPPTWRRFVQRVLPGAPPEQLAALRRDVAATAQRLRQFQHFVAADAQDDGEFAGFGRVDAFGAIFNRIAVGTLGIEENYRPADAPVNYPFLWGAAQLDVTQWNGSAPNRVPFGPLARNLGEAIGLFGGATLSRDGGAPAFHSPVKVANLHALEALTEKLRAPSWSDAGLPPVDMRAATRGYALYNRECRQCHALSFAKYPQPSPHAQYSHDCGQCHAEARTVSIDKVDTDALATRNYLERDAATGAMNGERKWLLLGDRYAARAPTRELVITAIVGVILDNKLGSLEAEDLPALARARPETEIAGYKARPLAGIWATAPYLHNGSVPTLADLLEPPEQRPRGFRTGPLQFDAERVGLGSADVGLPTTYFDTTLRGNSNRGHRFGTELEADDKRALLEFLKTL